MTLHLADLRDHVIRPTLALLGPRLATEAAVNLLLGTAAVESELGTWLDQATPGPGPAYGIYQMERPTLDDVWAKIGEWPQLRHAAADLAVAALAMHAQLAGNLYFATAMARLNYWRFPEPLPAANDVAGLAHYWKRRWNTTAGKGTVEGFQFRYRKYVHPQTGDRT